jgi:hypothetical protein
VFLSPTLSPSPMLSPSLSLHHERVMRTLDERVSELTGCPVSQQERLQVLKYEKDQYYLPHLDYWDPGIFIFLCV